MAASKDFVNRELSWLKFNGRVLSEAERPENPPLERAKFLAIVSSNLDEFFMVRVGKLERKIDAGLPVDDPSGMSPRGQLRAIRRAVKRQVARQDFVYQEELLPLLSQEGIQILKPGELSDQQSDWLSNYFDSQVMPVLTPRSINPSHPFPLLVAKRIYVAVLLQSDKGGQPQLSLVPVPASLKRFIPLPMGEGRIRGILLEDLILMSLGRLYPYAQPLASMPFRITRNTDFVVDIEHVDRLVEEMRKAIKRRSYGKIVRLELPAQAHAGILRRLMAGMEAPRAILQRVQSPLDLRFLLREFYGLPGFDPLRYPAFKPAVHQRLMAQESIFRTIRGGDLFFHHPYDSFDPVLRFIREAAEDKNVLAIKQTLYRVSAKSVLVPALARAAHLGKQVTVLVEVRARFDEENNINWCKVLEAAGCQVLYGVPLWKTHSKITLVVRREGGQLRQYLHLGTGNYNDVTAKLYTDMGILTCDRQLGEDASAFFNIITGYSYTFPLRELIISPYDLRKALVGRLAREAENARQGLPASFFAKMNSLSDPHMIEAIYAACEAGVQVRLLVRGICCLRPRRMPNLEVRSIVGRFLEHARVYLFGNGGEQEAFISSADLMPRNLDRRIELTTPVKDPAIRARLSAIMECQWQDNLQSWTLESDDEYRRLEPGFAPFNVQEYFIQEAKEQI